MKTDQTEHLVRLLSTYQVDIYRYVFSLLPNEQDAKDVVQETCVALLRKFSEFDQTRPFLPWAFRFAYLEVVRFRERKNRSGGFPLSDDVVRMLSTDWKANEQQLCARLNALDKCLDSLEPSDAALVRGRYQSSLPVALLAKEVAMSQRTLFRNLKRVRRLLFDCITRRLAGEGGSSS